WEDAEPGAVMIRITPCSGGLRLCGPRRRFTDSRRRRRDAGQAAGIVEWRGNLGSWWDKPGRRWLSSACVATSVVGHKHPGIAVNAEGIVMLEPQAEDRKSA